LHRPATFIVTFVATRDCVDAIKALRAVLKSALRAHGLRAVDVRELTDEPQQTRETEHEPT
jgi:hypothetical protein